MFAAGTCLLRPLPSGAAGRRCSSGLELQARLGQAGIEPLDHRVGDAEIGSRTPGIAAQDRRLPRGLVERGAGGLGVPDRRLGEGQSARSRPHSSGPCPSSALSRAPARSPSKILRQGQVGVVPGSVTTRLRSIASCSMRAASSERPRALQPPAELRQALGVVGVEGDRLPLHAARPRRHRRSCIAAPPATAGWGRCRAPARPLAAPGRAPSAVRDSRAVGSTKPNRAASRCAKASMAQAAAYSGSRRTASSR